MIINGSLLCVLATIWFLLLLQWVFPLVHLTAKLGTANVMKCIIDEFEGNPILPDQVRSLIHMLNQCLLRGHIRFSACNSLDEHQCILRLNRGISKP